MKKRISILTIIALLVCSLSVPVEVKAQTPYDAYKQGVEGLKEALEVDPNRTMTWTTEQMFKILQGMGFMINPTNWDLKIEALKQYAREHGLFGLTSESQSDDQTFCNAVNNSFLNNCNIENSTIVLGNYGTDLKALADYYATICGYYYAYSFDIHNNAGYFASVAQFQEVSSRLGDTNLRIGAGGQYKIFGKLLVSDNIAIVEVNHNYPGANTTWSGGCLFYDSYSGEQIKGPYEGFQVNSSGTVAGYTVNANGPGQFYLSKDPVGNCAGNNSVVLIGNKAVLYKVYYSVQDMAGDQLGDSGYYITDSFNNNSGVINSGTYNPVTYGDIRQYITNYYGDTGRYPSPNEINIYIENYIPDNPSDPDNPSGGGGSGSDSGSFVNNNNPIFNNNPNININLGGEGSGNGSGSVSGNGIFGWLGTLGSLIGGLISGIGEALTGILEGIIDAITSIIELVPNILSPLIEYVFGGLPEEIRALLVLGITAVIFVGIIKAIRK